MGSGASSNRKTRIHVIQALPGQDPLRQRTSHRRSSRDSSNSPTAAKSHKRPRPEESEWPLPETDSGESFTPKWPSNYRDRYSVKKAYHLKVRYRLLSLLARLRFIIASVRVIKFNYSQKKNDFISNDNLSFYS